MGLAFSLAEAINVGLGVAGGSAVKPIEARLQDVAFRRRLAKVAKATVEPLAQVPDADLRKLMADSKFLDDALSERWVPRESEQELDRVVDRVLQRSTFGDVESLGRALAEVFLRQAIENAEPIDRVILQSLDWVLRQQIRGNAEQISAIRELQERSTSTPPRRIVANSNSSIRVGRVPVPRKHFVGRQDLLAQMLALSNSRGRTVALTGLGGIGKTSIAAKFALDYTSNFKIVCWVRADTAEGIKHALAELTSAVGLDPPRQQDFEGQAKLALAHLESLEDNWLLVFDNVAGPNEIADWLPAGHQGTVIVTSRNRSIAEIATCLEVKVFSRDESSAFLVARVASENPAAGEDSPGAIRVAEALGGLPLALEQAGAWAARLPTRTWDLYLGLLASVDIEAAFPRSTRPIGYPDTVVSTWAVSIAAAQEENDLAQFLLGVLSWLSPTPIPLHIIEVLDRSADLMDGLAALNAYSLVEVHADATISVHRLVQTVTRHAAPQATLLAAAFGVVLAFPETVNDLPSWRAATAIEDHLLQVFRASEDGIDSVRGLREDLLEKTAVLGGAIAAWRSPAQGVEIYREVALETAQRRGDLDPDALRAQKNLAVLLLDAGRSAEGLAILESTLERQRASDEVSPRDVEHTKSALAVAFSRAGRFGDAAELLQSSHAVLDAQGSEQSRLMQLSNVAFNLQRAGEYHDALAIFEKIVPELVGLLGADHPDTMRARQGLASSYGDVGQLGKASRMLGDLLSDKRRVLGDGNVSTLRTWITLGSVIGDAGDTRQAMGIIEDALAVAQESLGERHSLTIELRQSVAVGLGRSGDVAGAVLLLERCYRDALGEDEVQTSVELEIGANLAAAYVDAGRPDDGIALLRRVVATGEPTYGRLHPLSMTWRSVLDSWIAEYELRTPLVSGAIVSRNGPCPCGSRKKYKQCHGATRRRPR
jgi:tetratricopeptide (TPR) repeat protein